MHNGRKKSLRERNDVFFSDIVHCYLNKDNKELIGVTSLMKKHGLSANYDGIPQAVLERAAQRGTAVHKLFEDYDNGAEVEQSPLLDSYIALGLDVLRSEYLVSDGELVASMIDKVLADGSLVDVKNTSELHVDAVTWQLSIYAYLFERQNPRIKVPHIYALHVKGGRCKELRELNRIPDEEIARLLECERNGELFIPASAHPLTLAQVWDEATISEVRRLEDALVQFEANAKATKAKLESLRSTLYDFMMANNIDKMETDTFSYTLKRPYERSSVDTKALAEQMPDVVAQFTKTTKVKGSVIFESK